MKPEILHCRKGGVFFSKIKTLEKNYDWKQKRNKREKTGQRPLPLLFVFFVCFLF